jgi:hypothetical protein
VQHLALLIFLRMLLKSLPFIFWNSWIFINFWIPFKRPVYSSIKTIFFKTLSLSCLHPWWLVQRCCTINKLWTQ